MMRVAEGIASLDKEKNMKTFLVTGGAGSLGGAVVKILSGFPDNIIRVLDINEAGLADLSRKNVRLLYGDVRDRDRVELAVCGVGSVVHCAALKNLDITEGNPEETILTNVMGTYNVALSAMAAGVKKAVFISSDKAVESTSLYGDTKAIGEKIWLWANRIQKDTKFSVVRPGNFFSSRGNVFERWEKQKREGMLVTVTHPDMERYFIELGSAAQFVVDVEEMMGGGEIFIPKMKCYRIIDLARKAAGGDESKIAITGIRPGEKLLEHLYSQQESVRLHENEDYLVIK